MKFWSLKAVTCCLAYAAVALIARPAPAATEVRIAAAHFPPYAVHPEQGGQQGLLPQLVGALNHLQERYVFVLVPTSLPRRYQDFEQGRVDMAIFENPDWGWQDIDHDSVDMGLEDAEVFVARRRGHTQDYFSDLEGKRLALFSGYHYAFAGFDANPQYLLRRFRASLTYSHESNLMMVLRDRADIALVTRSYLSDFVAAHPELAPRMLISERIDQRYQHHALLRPQAPIQAAEFKRLLDELRSNGQLAGIFSPLQIAVVPEVTDPVVVRNPSRRAVRP